jgi:hypothetical protein
MCKEIFTISEIKPNAYIAYISQTFNAGAFYSRIPSLSAYLGKCLKEINAGR